MSVPTPTSGQHHQHQQSACLLCSWSLRCASPPPSPPRRRQYADLLQDCRLLSAEKDNLLLLQGDARDSLMMVVNGLLRCAPPVPDC